VAPPKYGRAEARAHAWGAVGVSEVKNFEVTFSGPRPHAAWKRDAHRRGPGDGAYAQCDSGLCFPSTEETTFPGFDKPVPEAQIIFSCPITQAIGPYPCDKSFLRYCKAVTANSRTGSMIYVGAPKLP
jgi:hypothetical protein